MKFIANSLNNNYLKYILPTSENEVDGVLAAIAYGSEGANSKEDFISNCIKNEYRLDIWMRYDETVPVSVPLLRRLLANHKNNIFCRLIPDVLHSKVIWWKGYGAYIGSANLTERAWITNLEAGVFLSDEELQTTDMILSLEEFFESIQQLDKSYPLSDDIIQEMEHFSKHRERIRKMGGPKRRIPKWGGPQLTKPQATFDRRKQNFQSEWLETLSVLDSIAEQLKKLRPTWIGDEVPYEWQADQFLHAYYYNHVRENRSIPFEKFYQKNKSNPQKSLQEAMLWWAKTTSPPSNENVTFDKYAPYIRKHLHIDSVLNIDVNILANVCRYTHATVNHYTKISPAFFGIPSKETLSIEDRTPLFASWLMAQKNSKGLGIRELWKYVLYGGKDSDIWDRLFTAGMTKEHSLPHYKLSSLSELIGWARPEISPPRNGRTSKALRALGYDVKIY